MQSITVYSFVYINSTKPNTVDSSRELYFYSIYTSVNCKYTLLYNSIIYTPSIQSQFTVRSSCNLGQYTVQQFTCSHTMQSSQPTQFTVLFNITSTKANTVYSSRELYFHSYYTSATENIPFYTVQLFALDTNHTVYSSQKL